jgi:hypothetical protein
MKGIVILLVVASTACASLHKGGARGPVIQRTEQPADQQNPRTVDQTSSLDGRGDLGQL